MTSEPVKFLLVDDTEENLIALEALLRRDGLEILKARSGPAALELLLVHEVALAILDVQMPDMDGFELAELMRGAERTKRVPIIFVTAGARDPERVFQGYETGAVDFLFKPIEPLVLKGKAEVFFELFRQRRELTSSLRLNEMFVGMVGHNLRNPLSALQTGALLLQKQLTDETQLRTLRRMTSAAGRMNVMIEQMLDLTRARLADGLGFVRSVASVDVAHLVRHTIEELRGANAEREIVVEANGDSTTTGDAHRLLQLLSNLVANALHHGTPGSPVTVAVEGGAEEVVVRIANRGAIPAELLPRLFDPFRGRQGSSKSVGLGLGLFISQQIAHAHGGTIAAESSEDAGTVFTVRLPRRAASAAQPSPGGAKKVLIVDDDAGVRDALRQALEVEGYAAITAGDGREALELLGLGPPRPDAVILDVVMPIMDGSRVYEAMQADAALAKIPVIVSTSNPAVAPSGAILVPKPLRLERLLETLAEVFRSSGG